jgi:hypothetical protein
MTLRLSLVASILSLALFPAWGAPPGVRLRRSVAGRSGPALSSSEQALLPGGAHYAALDQRGGFTRIQAGAKRLWVSTSDTAPSLAALRVVVADRLQVRAEPGGARLGALVEGTWIVERERRGAWVRFDFGQRGAWVHGDYLLSANAGSGALADYYLRRARREGSKPEHLAFLDRGPSAERRVDGQRAPARLARGLTPSNTPRVRDRFPRVGQQPARIDAAVLDFVQNLCLVRVERSSLGVLGAWRGIRPFANDQYWSATKHLQALAVIQRLNARDPLSRVEGLQLRDAGGTSRRLGDVLRAIVSYERGVWFSNAASGTLGRFRTRAERERELLALTGHRAEFRGDYGARSFTARPRLLSAGGQVVLTSPAAEGARGANLVSAYDLTRALSMIAWHRSLAPGERVPSAQWHSLEPLVSALTHDPARYLDLALDHLGLSERLREVVILSKLGHGVRSRTGLAEIAYTALLQARDAWTGREISFCFSLRVEHRDAVVCDARTAAAVTTLVRSQIGN